MNGRFDLQFGPDGPISGEGELLDLGADPFDTLEGLLTDSAPDDLYVGYFAYSGPSLWLRGVGGCGERPRPALSRSAALDSLGIGASSRSPYPTNPTEASLRTPQSATPPAWYVKAFDQVQEELHAGNSYEVNLTFRENVQSPVSPEEVYARLLSINAAPYAGMVAADDGRALVSSSPERFAKVNARVLETKPIKGTLPRGATPEADAELARRLASEPKFRAENLMIVDLLRHDLATVCEVGSVEVPKLMDVESYASVHQLVSTVRGRLHEGISTVQALRALFPAGSMTGAPKKRTMEIIQSVEASPRGVYAGAFGWIRGDGTCDLGVVIRSLSTDGTGTWTFGTGGGITVDSEVGDEWREAELKAERLRRALG